MPIVRTYGCEHCGNFIEVTLEGHEYDAPPPECPYCNETRSMQQEFKAPGIIGHTARSKAEAIKDDILANDYHVADIEHDKYDGPKVRYKDSSRTPAQASTWQATSAELQSAVALGRQNRLKFGSGLDILQNNLKRGTEVDLIEVSKERMRRQQGKVW